MEIQGMTMAMVVKVTLSTEDWHKIQNNLSRVKSQGVHSDISSAVQDLSVSRRDRGGLAIQWPNG